LRFRDSLRADAKLRDAYAALKRELAARYPTDRPRYTAEKTAFIEGVVGMDESQVSSSVRPTPRDE
jgi:GrpB-like predicted nucleotidyltransferase (UPF0157 family)